ncbi:hypothetical protein [Nonomuraea lactucae]|uniref:hypothetical protein n=1 Tax=Nonomuraea lactucae TaxID=2249762 RepID=UPI001965D645|nr:hypothetical protein [Nonomuraea lactucae]
MSTPPLAGELGVRRLLVAAGLLPVVRLLPTREARPELLAAVRMGDARPASAGQRDLYDLIWARRTNREPFEDRRVPPAVLAELRIAASREGANLVPLDRHASAETLDHVAMAEDELSRDRDYRAGQALQRVLLMAAGHGVSASFLNQPMDLRDMRDRRDPRHRLGHPQMIIRLGYGPFVAAGQRRQRLRTSAPYPRSVPGVLMREGTGHGLAPAHRKG